MAGETKKTTRRVAGKRSPNYPATNLKDAINNVNTLYKADGRAGSLRLSAYKHLGYGGENGASIAVLSSMKRYGLIQEVNNRILLTPEAEIILISTDEEKKLDTIRKCALKPESFNKIWKEYEGKNLPSDASLRELLIFHHGFNENKVKIFIQNFKETLEFAQLNPEEYEEGQPEDESSEQEREIGTNIMSSNLSQTSTDQNKVIFEDFTIPQKGKAPAVLRISKPVNKADVENIKKWLDFFGDTIIDEENDKE